MDRTSFQYVSDMNTAFGNPKGDPMRFRPERIRKQVKSVLDEYNEFEEGMDLLETYLLLCREYNVEFDRVVYNKILNKVRDALCDIQVFTMGAQHLIGVDGDADMAAVLDGVMTRFCRTPEELEATKAHFAARGITETYTQGDFPKMILKSAVDQPDAPKDKFLKSVGYTDAVFPPV